MYAEYVSDGYWVDVHISKVLYTKADHALFERVINSIAFSPKRGILAAVFDARLIKGRTAALDWLEPMGQEQVQRELCGSCSVDPRGIGETAWFGYCLRTIQDLGANKSRKLIGAAFARSLPAKTDHPLAVLAYPSAFENQPSIVSSPL